MKTETSLSGYKHTDEAKLKMLKRFEKKNLIILCIVKHIVMTYVN